MNKRDYTQQILDIKQRDSRSKSFSVHELINLQQKWLKNYKNDVCEPDFFVIRAVTLLEVFTRKNLANLIDHDKKFTEEAINLKVTVKIDLELLSNIQNRTITLGDILAHSISVNSFVHIVSHFQIVLKKQIRPLLEKAVDRWESEVKKKATVPIIDDYDKLAKSLNRLFEVRHILCHEAPKQSIYEISEINEFLDQAVRFTKALNEILLFEKFGLVPLTQKDMNISARNDFKKTDEKMNCLLSEVNKKIDKNKKYLDYLNDAQEKWISYKIAQCEFHTYDSQGGSIRPVFWTSEAKRLTEERIAIFETWLEKVTQEEIALSNILRDREKKYKEQNNAN